VVTVIRQKSGLVKGLEGPFGIECCLGVPAKEKFFGRNGEQSFCFGQRSVEVVVRSRAVVCHGEHRPGGDAVGNQFHGLVEVFDGLFDLALVQCDLPAEHAQLARGAAQLLRLTNGLVRRFEIVLPGRQQGFVSITCPVPSGCRRVPRPAGAGGRLPRVSRWMALALHLDELLRQGAIGDQSELARLGRVSPARVSQIMNLLHLAPDIQEQLLFLPPIHTGRDPILLHQLQPLAAMADWNRQRRKWLRLVRRCTPS
jgi:hypothetical protein